MQENGFSSVQFSSVVQSCCVWLFATPWTAASQASLSIPNSRSLLKLMSIESVMPSNHLILCPPLLFLPSVFPCIRVFSNESTLHIRWPKYWLAKTVQLNEVIFSEDGWVGIKSPRAAVTSSKGLSTRARRLIREPEAQMEISQTLSSLGKVAV